MRPGTRGRSKVGAKIGARRRRRIVVWRRSDSDEGSVIVEFALVFPIFAILLFGMVQFGFVFNGWTSQRNSVQTAARLGSINDLESDCTAGGCGNCKQGNDALTAGVNLDTANMICTVSDLIGQPVGITGSPEIDLLVQNGLLTVCSQVQAEPLAGPWPNMTLSTTSSFYIDQPGSAPLSATGLTGMTSVTSSNNTLTYDIDVSGQATPTSVNATIAVGDYDPSDLATEIQAAIDTASASAVLPQDEIPSVTEQNDLGPPVTGSIEFALFPELHDPDVEMADVGGSAIASPTGTGFLALSGTSTDNDLLESYNPDLIPACASAPALYVSAPSEDADGTEMAISALLDGVTHSASGTITFDYFQQPDLPTAAECTAGGTEVVTPTPTTVTGDGVYAVNFTPPPPTGAGNYWWYASYSGDPNNAAATSLCGSGMPETVVQ
jgi:TadE-like protein